MADAKTPDSDSLFRRTLGECRDLFVSSATDCAQEHPQLLPQGKNKRALTAEEFITLMDDLHRGAVLKVYFSVVEADRKWSNRERFLAEVLFDHLWGKRLTGEELRTAARRLADDASKLKWYSIVRPFDQIVPLREHVGALETIVMRLANLVARADGELQWTEAGVVKSIQDELHHHLRADSDRRAQRARCGERGRATGDRDAQERSAGYLFGDKQGGRRAEEGRGKEDTGRRASAPLLAWRKRSRSSTD